MSQEREHDEHDDDDYVPELHTDSEPDTDSDDENDDNEHKHSSSIPSNKSTSEEEEDDNMDDEEHEQRHAHERRRRHGRRESEWVTTSELGSDAFVLNDNDTNDPLEKKSEGEVCAWACMAMQAIQQSTQPNSIKQAYERNDAKLYDIAIKKEMKQFEKYESFTLIKKKNIPNNAEIVPSKFVFTDKTDATNKFIERKQGWLGVVIWKGSLVRRRLKHIHPHHQTEQSVHTLPTQHREVGVPTNLMFRLHTYTHA